MNPIPQTLGEEVTAGINALLHASDRFRDWNSPDVRTIFARIEELEKADGVDAYVRFGALAAICGNVDAVLAYYKQALSADDGEFEATIKHEFWVSMSNAGLYAQCQEIGVSLLEPKMGFFGKIWERVAGMGLVLTVRKFLPAAKRLYPKLNEVDFSSVERTAAVMEERGLTEEAVVSVFDLMGRIQRSHGIMYSGDLASVLRVLRPPEDPPYVYFAMPLNASVAEIHAMNRDLTRFVVEKLGAFPGGMVASFAKTPLELRAAA